MREHSMKYDVKSGLDCEQLRALLSLSHDFLQVEHMSNVLELVGHAVSDLTGARTGLLIVRGEREYAIGFDQHGVPHPVLPDHPFYRVASGVFSGAQEAGDGPEQAQRMLLVGMPARAPVAAVAAWWDATDRGISWDEREQLLQLIMQHAAAAIEKLEARSSLEQLMQTHYGQMQEAASVHAAELTRRDVIEREMQALSLTDLMTGLNNRRGFFVHADHMFRIAQRRLEYSAVIFADVDGLKAINDRFGHEVGDKLICDAASMFRESFREVDVVARLGGDEFVSYTLDAAQPDLILDRLQRKLHVFNLMQQRPYQISISAGVVRCDPHDDQELSRYILLADQQMYAHKHRHLH
jgi:diguanylate cyclase (GGDEF)-like protein